MRITYDPVADAAYVTLGDHVAAGEAAQQVPLIDTPNGQTQVTIDVDKDGYLIGFEILSASNGLPKTLLERAESA